MHLLTLGAYWHPVTVNDTSRVRVLLNVPFSARCFLTSSLRRHSTPFWISLNAPYGARCFLTKFLSEQHLDLVPNVLMHLMALGAF